jgi:hypothetical protein
MNAVMLDFGGNGRLALGGGMSSLEQATPKQLALALARHRKPGQRKGGPKATFVAGPRCGAEVTKTEATRRRRHTRNPSEVTRSDTEHVCPLVRLPLLREQDELTEFGKSA